MTLVQMFAQVGQAAAQVVQAATPQPTEAMPLVVSAALIMYAQKFLKTRPTYMQLVQAIPMADKWIHRIVAGTGSLIAALGIHYTFSWTFAAGGHLSADIPAGWQLLRGFGDFFSVGVMQQIFYDATRKPMGMPHDQPAAVVASPMVDALKKETP